MKQALFLYNPQSGKGKIEKDSQAIGEMFRQAGYSIVDGPIDFSRNPFNGHETSIWWSWRAATARSITWSIG